MTWGDNVKKQKTLDRIWGACHCPFQVQQQATFGLQPKIVTLIILFKHMYFFFLAVLGLHCSAGSSLVAA